jgi:hypothetical protein
MRSLFAYTVLRANAEWLYRAPIVRGETVIIKPAFGNERVGEMEVANTVVRAPMADGNGSLGSGITVS